MIFRAAVKGRSADETELVADAEDVAAGFVARLRSGHVGKAAVGAIRLKEKVTVIFFVGVINKATDGEYRTSKIDLDFDLGESGSLAGLKSADGVKLKFSIYNTDAEVATLTKDQFINGKLKLRVREGLTVDIFDFLNAEEE